MPNGETQRGSWWRRVAWPERWATCNASGGEARWRLGRGERAENRGKANGMVSRRHREASGGGKIENPRCLALGGEIPGRRVI